MQDTMTVFDVFTEIGIGVYVDDTKAASCKPEKETGSADHTSFVQTLDAQLPEVKLDARRKGRRGQL